MTIKLTENTVGIWAVNMGNDSDWLGSLWRERDLWIMEYRFRYYVDDLTFDSKDRKNWYRCEVKMSDNTQDEVVAAMRESARVLWQKSGGQRYELMMDAGGIERMMEDMAKWPMMSMKTGKLDEAGNVDAAGKS